jgi:endonuclease I
VPRVQNIRRLVGLRWSLVSPLFLASNLAFAQSGAPLHYYDAAIGKTGLALKAALQGIIRNHTAIPYTASTTDTWDALKVLDEDPASSSYVLLVYSGFADLKSNQYTGSSGTWDREHLWPQSFGMSALNSNSRAKSDLFNLRPIDATVNSARGNKYYDDSTPPASTHPEAPGSTYDNNSWQPRAEEKGAIARTMFYMAVRYDGSDPDVPDLELSDTPNSAQAAFGKLSTLLAWHRQFAVGTAERYRNERVYSDYQHNRNPFVDHPDYAEMVFLGVSPGEAWKHTHFTAAGIADPSISGDAADPEGDGLGNLLEYLVNGDPWAPQVSAALIASVTSQANSHSVLVTYSRNRNATDVTVSYETSTDLKTWTAAPSQLVSAVVTSSETEQVTVSLPAAASGQLVRLRATRSTP